MNRFLIPLFFVACPLSTVFAQGKIQKLPIDQPAAWQIYNRELETVSKDSVSFKPGPEDGTWIWKGGNVQPTGIEFDVRGENNMNQNFVGIAFNIQEDKRYEVVYLRPFNFYNPDTVRRWRAVQYTYMPAFPWEKLRAEHPGQYENRIEKAPDPDKWFHVRITIEHPVLKVFIDRKSAPSLVVNRLAPNTPGKFALWLGPQSRGSFANVVITHQPGSGDAGTAGASKATGTIGATGAPGGADATGPTGTATATKAAGAPDAARTTGATGGTGDTKGAGTGKAAAKTTGTAIATKTAGAPDAPDVAKAADATPPAPTTPYGNNPAAGQYLTVGDTKLYYETYGKGDPVVLLHGGVYGYIDEFQPLIDELRKNHEVICIATRGHGKSYIGNTPFTWAQRAEDAYAVIRQLTKGKVTVIGFSDGGAAAFKLAALHPEVVGRLVTIGFGDAPKGRFQPPLAYSPAMLMGQAKGLFDSRLALMPEPDRWGQCLDWLNDLYNNDPVSTETFTRVQCPTLVMTGDQDVFHPVAGVKVAADLIPGSQLAVIPSCGHVVIACNFPLVWQHIAAFLAGKAG